MAESILVVDDEQEIADLVEVYLHNEGYTVHKFYNAKDALNCLDKTTISLALLDVMLPDMDGFSLCRQIRQKFYFPIIMLTAKVEDMDKIMGLTVGADDYVCSKSRYALHGNRCKSRCISDSLPVSCRLRCTPAIFSNWWCCKWDSLKYSNSRIRCFNSAHPSVFSLCLSYHQKTSFFLSPKQTLRNFMNTQLVCAEKEALS